MKNELLAIAIPTFNRAEILFDNISKMLEEVKEFSIPVYISDDSTGDQTRLNYERLKSQYEYIYYKKNTPALGHDLNCISTLEMTSEEYIWYLGDSYSITKGGIREVLSLVKSYSPDFISVNSSDRVKLPSRLFTDENEILISIGWHLTLTGATIYNRNAIISFKKDDLLWCRNFPQTAIVFEYLADKKDPSLFWSDKNLVIGSTNKKSYWRDRTFDVFIVDWNNMVMNLPTSYSKENKDALVRMHSRETGIFNIYSFLLYRSEGIYSLQVLWHYYRTIRQVSDVNPVFLIFIALTPKCVIKFAGTLKHKLLFYV